MINFQIDSSKLLSNLFILILSTHNRYTNFGVFQLYHDSALANSMDVALQMCLAVPTADLAAYLKRLKTYYFFIELVARNHITYMMSLDPVNVANIVGALEEGLLAFDPSVSMQCCQVRLLISFSPRRKINSTLISIRF